MNLRRALSLKCRVPSSLLFQRTNSSLSASRPPPFKPLPPSSLFDESGRSTVVVPPQRRLTRQDPCLFLLSAPKLPESNVSDDQRALIAHLRKGMLSFVQIACTPTADTPGTTLYIHFDNKRYILGHVGEGTQRAFTQRKTSVARIDSIFLAGPVTWRTAGGLMGLVLTMADVLNASKTDSTERGKKSKKALAEAPLSLRVHAGENLSYFLAAGRRFILRKGLPLGLHEIQRDPQNGPSGTGAAVSKVEPDWQDENMKVWYVPVDSNQNPSPTPKLRKRSHEEFENDEGTAPNASVAEERKAILDAAVTQMFNSDWSIDALMETTLHKVELPAKIFVREHGHLQEYTGPLPGAGQEVPDIPVWIRRPWPAALFSTLPETQPSRESMCYIIKLHDRRGKFNAQEAVRLGVQPRDFKHLTCMQNVTAKDGTVVTPAMVLGESARGHGFAFVDVPDVSYIDSLVSRPEWSDSQKMDGVKIIYWSLGRGVSSDTRLQDFMKKMSDVRHVVTSPDETPNMLALESTAVQAYKLRCIDPDRFSLPSHSNNASLSGHDIPSDDSPLYERGRTGKQIQFAPNFIHQDDKVIPFPDIPTLAADGFPEGVLELAAQAKSKVSDPGFLARIEKEEADIPNRDAEVITLGTGSALPSKYRNVSATLVRVPGYGSYLFDAGENTLGQLRRVFGSELPSVLRDLKVIWISHLHADHHLGMVSVIKAWHEETRESAPSSKLIIASHNIITGFLKEYSQVEPYGFERLNLIAFTKSNKGASNPYPKRAFSPSETAQCGLEKIEACWVSHCAGAMATVFTLPSGFKVAYSGDCRPSDDFAKIGKGATLLIHESTFEDELRGDAIAKKHSTMSEAIGVGRKMGARRILLTHFSQRYQKIPTVEEDFGSGDEARTSGKARANEVILVGFDYMRVKIGDFRKARAFLPAIQKMLENESDA